MGRKEDNIKKAQSIIHDKPRIRNIGTAAHIDHGKCLSADARAWVNSRWIRAEDLWSQFADRPPVSNDRGAEVRDVRSDSLWTQSLDMETGTVGFAQITHVWRLRATGPLVEVESRDGRRIRTTSEHPFVVASGAGLEYKEANTLLAGDVLAVPRRLPSRDEGDEDWTAMEEGLVRKLASDPRTRFHLSREAQSRMRTSGPADGQRLLHLAEAAEIPVAALYPMVESVSVQFSSRGGRSAREVRLPDRSELESFFWLVGLLYGDGDGQARIHMKDENLIERARIVMNRFTGSASISRYSRVPYLKPGSSSFVRLLQVLFGYPEKRKAWSIRLPSILHIAPLPVAAAFIQGYMDADGGVEKARSAVSATSVSEEFLDELQLLLLRFGVRAILLRRRGKNTLYVSGRKNLARMPQFSDPEKAALQKELEKKSSTSYVVDLLPVDWKKLAHDDWKSRFYATAGQQPSAQSLLSMARVDLSAAEPFLNEEVAFVEVKAIRSATEDWVYDFSVPGPQNFVAEGLFIHNTTLSDSLIAGAGMISEELAGTQLFMDFDEQEQARGITINAAIASMVHEFEGKSYLINLIDTPGHVDFGGDVTRAMRAIDGVIILDDAVEGVMPQTETVIRQAIKERVKPVLFINKVDRLINELKLDADRMQQRFVKIITEINARILKLLPDDLKGPWALSVESGNVAFGSARNKWAISVPYMKKTGIMFKDIYKYLSEDKQSELSKRAPLHQVVLDMVIRHLPNPLEAQPMRIPVIWKGDLESPVGKAMMKVKEDGPVGFMITKIIVDPQAGEVAAGRLFSGRIKRGQELWVSGMPKPQRVQTVAMIVGPERIPVEEIDAGNVVAAIGLKDAIAGSTVSDDKAMQAFEPIVHYSEPVVTVAIEAKSTADLPKLVDVLRSIAKADPSIEVEINQETGEHLMSGMGELHLEITQYRIVNDYKVPITASTPIVVYRERVRGAGGPFEGKSPNKHNRFYFEVEPLGDKVVAAIHDGEIPSGQRIKDAKALAKQLQDLGMDKDEAKNVVWIRDTNMLLDVTKGIQYLNETMELVKESFIEAMTKGPLGQEKCMGMKVRVVDAKLHEDSVHRGPAQVIPAVRSAIYGAMCQGDRILMEPIQKLFLNLPQDVMGAAIGDVQSRRGVIEDIRQEGETTTIAAKVPVSAMFGFATAIRGATQGRVLWSTENSGFQPVPSELQHDVVKGIRERKGLSPEPYDEAYYAA